MLHSLRYVVPAAGIDVSAPLPRWAEPARGLLQELRAAEDALPDSAASRAAHTAAAITRSQDEAVSRRRRRRKESPEEYIARNRAAHPNKGPAGVCQ
jgi:hypothetical protein